MTITTSIKMYTQQYYDEIYDNALKQSIEQLKVQIKADVYKKNVEKEYSTGPILTEEQSKLYIDLRNKRGDIKFIQFEDLSAYRKQDWYNYIISGKAQKELDTWIAKQKSIRFINK